MFRTESHHQQSVEARSQWTAGQLDKQKKYNLSKVNNVKINPTESHNNTWWGQCILTVAPWTFCWHTCSEMVYLAEDTTLVATDRTDSASPNALSCISSCSWCFRADSENQERRRKRQQEKHPQQHPQQHPPQEDPKAAVDRPHARGSCIQVGSSSGNSRSNAWAMTADGPLRVDGSTLKAVLPQQLCDVSFAAYRQHTAFFSPESTKRSLKCFQCLFVLRIGFAHSFIGKFESNKEARSFITPITGRWGDYRVTLQQYLPTQPRQLVVCLPPCLWSAQDYSWEYQALQPLEQNSGGSCHSGDTVMWPALGTLDVPREDSERKPPTDWSAARIAAGSGLWKFKAFSTFSFIASPREMSGFWGTGGAGGARLGGAGDAGRGAACRGSLPAYCMITESV